MSAPTLMAQRISGLLHAEGVRHCAWKGDPQVARFEEGGGDLDLLVDRSQLALLMTTLASFGFRSALAAPGLVEPSVVSFVAPHPAGGALLHVHVHLQLLIGAGGRAQFRLPFEREMLETALTREGMRVAAPELALISHVLHQTLRHDIRSLVAMRDPTWIRQPLPTLSLLMGRTTPQATERARARCLPAVSAALLERCTASLVVGTPSWERVAIATGLRRALRPHRRAADPFQLARLAAARVATVLTGLGHLIGRTPDPRPTPGRARPGSGGGVVALVGGDGAGKSTCAVALCEWLGSTYDVRHDHLGRPPRGALTYLVGALRRASAAARGGDDEGWRARLDDHLQLARVVCTGRDRARLHARVHRHAAGGGIAIVERHPMPPQDILAGPSEVQRLATTARSWFATWLRRYERGLYARLAPPDLALVLRVDPELAVRRKPEEPEAYVRRRAKLVWDRDWDRPGVRVIDAGRALPDVLRDLRARVWEAL